MVETRTVTQVPVRLEKHDFQRPGSTKAFTSAIRSWVRKPNVSTENPHQAQCFAVLIIGDELISVRMVLGRHSQHVGIEFRIKTETVKNVR